ncbi:MAG: Neogenin, partial [Chloroflexi bacterium]
MTVSLAATDDLSGVAATYFGLDGHAAVAGTSVSIAADGVHDLIYWSVDKAGNEEVHHTARIEVDQTPPTIGYSLDELPNGAGWLNHDVKVTFTCGDATSGIASCPDPQTVSVEAAGEVATGTALDNAGNKASVSVTINLDKTPPTISAAPDRPANAHGWYRDDVTVGFTCGDTLSGIASCPAAQTLSQGAAQTAAGTALDVAGNQASTSLGNLNVDETPPTISGAPDRAANANGWYKADVSVGFQCSDLLSGIDPSGGCPAPSTLHEGAGQFVNGTATDLAGNTSSDRVGPLNIDETAPSISGAPDRAANARGWYRAEVTVAFTCGDTLSGVAGCSTPVTLGEGGGQSVSGVANDKAGNAAGTVVSRINVDQTPPTISGAPDRAPNAGGWYNADVTVSFQCADGLSGVVSCSPPSKLGEGAAQAVVGTAVDAADNTSSATVSGLNIDKTAPVVSAAADRSANGNG